MPRKIRPFSPDHPVNICARANNRDWFRIPMDDVWRIYEDHLYFVHHAYDVKIHLFVLMANHYHMIARFPAANMGASMNYFNRETAKAICRATKQINHVYGNRYYRSSIQALHYYEHAYKYNYRNPVEANACLKVEDYRYSTLAGLLGRRTLYIPLEEDTLLLNDPGDTLQWLNREVDPDHRIAIRKALKKRTFALAKDPTNHRKPHLLEVSRY